MALNTAAEFAYLSAPRRPDAKNHLYHQSIKQGDLLLNKLQKLSKVIDLE